MMDIVNKETRSRMMSSVRAKDTKLETSIRHRLFAQGFRYRLHVRSLPGTPDMVLPKYTAALFVHGCFWHAHGCVRSAPPKTRAKWWREKLEGNRRRDDRNLDALRQEGWRVVVIWECAARRPGVDSDKALDRICDRVARFLRSNRRTLEVSGPLPAGSAKGR